MSVHRRPPPWAFAEPASRALDYPSDQRVALALRDFDLRHRLSSILWRVCLVGVTCGLVVAAPSSFAASHGSYRVRTLASVRGRVELFAQDRGHLAWLKATSRASCGQVVFLDLRTGVRSQPQPSHACSGAYSLPASLVLAGGSAYWLDLNSTAETAYSTLESASPYRRRAADLGFAQSIDKWGSAGLVPVASDGRSAYAVMSPDDGTPGPIFRWSGTGGGAVTGTIPAVEALAVAADGSPMPAPRDGRSTARRIRPGHPTARRSPSHARGCSPTPAAAQVGSGS
jgi:hypothetical protein